MLARIMQLLFLRRMWHAVRARRARAAPLTPARQCAEMLDLLLGVVRRLLALVQRLVLRLSARRAGLVLVYHRVGGQTGDPEHQLVPPHGARLFDAHLRHLRARYRPVTASQLPEAIRTRRRGQRFPVAVTFDDDLWCHTAVAMPLLIRHEIAATFFLCGASLEGPHSFWWELLDRAADVGALDESWRSRTLQRGEQPSQADDVALIHRLGRAIETMAPHERDGTVQELRSLVTEPRLHLGEQETDALARGGAEIGFHTLRHHRLPTLDDEDLAVAMREGRAELQSVVGEDLGVLAYPHGRADARVAAAARRAGYRYAFTTVAQPITPEDDPLLLGRCEPSFRSYGHFVRELVSLLASAPHPARR